MKPRRPSIVAPRQPAAPLARRRRLTAFPALALAGLLAACGGSDGPTPPGSSPTSVRFDVATQAALVTGTTGTTVRIVPTYERASGERVALAAQSAAYAGGAAQTLPFTVDLAPCFNDAARRAADQGTGANAVCVVGAAVTLQSAGRTLDSVAVGPFNLKAGAVTTIPASFVEVASVRVTRAGGVAVGPQPVALQVGQTLGLTATAIDPSGAGLTRPVSLTSSAPAVATVDPATGVVTAVGFGTARIVAAAGGRETAVEISVQPTLAVTLAGAGVGTVTSAPAGINCAAAAAAGCTAAFASGTSVTLTATPDANSSFTGWTGACAGTGACTVALDQARAVTANFGRRRVTLTVNVSGAAPGNVLVTGGNVSTPNTCAIAAGQSTGCTFTVDAGTTINLTARPDANSRLGAWSGACAGTTGLTCALTPTGDAAAAVTFVVRPTPDQVSVSAVGTVAGEFGGSLGVTGFVNGQPTASQFSFGLRTTAPVNGLEFDQTSPVTLRFEPNAQSRLVGWGGLCAGAAVEPTGVSTCTFTSTANSQVTVTLAPR